MKIKESIWLVIASLVLIVSSSHSNSTYSIPFKRPILRADMFVFKYEVGLKYERTVKLSPTMLLHITNSFFIFSTSVCPSVNKFLVGYFIKHFDILIMEKNFPSMPFYADMAYFGYENSIKYCLKSLPLSIIRLVRNTKGESSSEPVPNLKLAPITQEIDFKYWEDEDDSEEYEESNTMESVEDEEEEEYLWNEEYDKYDIEPEEDGIICEHDECREVIEEEDYFLDYDYSELLNRLKSLLQIMLSEFYDLCPHYHKIYVQLWRKYYWGMLELFKENADIMKEMGYHFRPRGFIDELKRCSSKRTLVRELLDLDFEIGNIVPLT